MKFNEEKERKRWRHKQTDWMASKMYVNNDCQTELDGAISIVSILFVL